MTIRIVVAHHKAESCQRWREALARELPQAEVSIWSHGETSAGADYALASVAPPAEFFEQHPQLRAFFSTGAGVEKLIDAPFMPAHLPVIRLEDAGMGVQMALYCVGATLDWIRRRDEYMSLQRAHEWGPLPEADVQDWPVGVFGLGVLGQQVARAFADLGFPVNGYSRSVHRLAGVRCFAESGGAGNFEDFLGATRVLVLVAPLTAQTRDRFDHAALARLEPPAYVVNVARGELLVDEALLDHLASGHLAGAALDVFREEPLPSAHRFWSHPAIRITPHVSAITVVGPSARQIAEKIRRLERGETVSGVVDRTRGY